MPDLNGKTCLILAPETALTIAVRDSLERAGASVSTHDVTTATEAAWDKGMAEAVPATQTLDAIINIAVPDSGGTIGTLSSDVFHNILEASYIRNWLALKYGIPLLRASGGGSFITITSVDGKYGVPAAAARCAASNGIVMMTKSASLESAAKKDNVRINTLLVGDIMPGEHDAFAPGHVSPDDVGAAVTHLASDASIYITGLIMPVDNGAVVV